MTGRFAILVLIVFVAGFAVVYQASCIPALINYQGEVKDSQGDPLDGIHTMQFRIYSAPDTGSALWGEQQSVDVNEGIYNVFLGAGAKITAGDDLGPTIFSSGDRWLEVTIDGETLAPRQRISSVAFAFRASEALYAETASDADTVDGREAAEFADLNHVHTGDDIHGGTIAESFIDNDIARDSEITWSNLGGIPVEIADGDDVGIAAETDPTITDPSIKDGVSWSELSGIPTGFADGTDNTGIVTEVDPQVGANTTNRIPKWNGSQLVTGAIHDSGNIGIGLTNPSKMLHVEVDSSQVEYALKLDNDNNIFNSGVGILFAPGGDGPDRGKGGLVYEYTNTWNRGKFHFLQRSDATSQVAGISNSVMTVANDGNVGIGTTDPNEKLQVAGDMLVGTNSKGIKLRASSTLVDLEPTGTDLVINNSTGQDTLLNVSQGNVGIGKWTPEEKLDVTGNVRIQGDLIVEGAYKGILGDTNVEGAPFPRPAWGSGWIYYAQGECKTLDHGLGGDVNHYVVDMQFKTEAGTDPNGIHQFNYGSRSFYDDLFTNSNQIYGGWWEKLTTSSIDICRAADSAWIQHIRVRIWVYN
jgi:hypothetical protein